MQGKIIHWNEERGFGLVKENITAQELFIHISALNIRIPAPKEGEEVEFETEFDEKKGKTVVKWARYLHRPVEIKMTEDAKNNHREYENYGGRSAPADSRRQRKDTGANWKYLIIILILLAVLCVLGYAILNKGLF